MYKELHFARGSDGDKTFHVVVASELLPRSRNRHILEHTRGCCRTFQLPSECHVWLDYAYCWTANDQKRDGQIRNVSIVTFVYRKSDLPLRGGMGDAL